MINGKAVIDSEQSFLGWRGELSLSFAKRGNSTQLIHNFSQAPLRIQRSFYPEGEEVCHSVILHTAGGMVGGDRLNINVDVQAQAHALVTTAAAHKIYRSDGQQVTQQNITLKVAEGARLEWLPQETIVFDASVFRQSLKVELAANATWLGWEITRLGRTARGEKFTEGQVRSLTEVWQGGEPIWIDRQLLIGGETAIASQNSLANKSVVGSLAWLGQPISQDIVAKLRSSCPTSITGEFGFTTLEKGLLCRYRGDSVSEARVIFMHVWQILRLSFWQRPISPPRIWLLSKSDRVAS